MQADQGEGSMLHIVIFDEIDAICKTRGSVRDGTGVSDSVVNQLLSKIDGVDSLNNVLIIGMTNRKVRARASSLDSAASTNARHHLPASLSLLVSRCPSQCACALGLGSESSFAWGMRPPAHVIVCPAFWIFPLGVC